MPTETLKRNPSFFLLIFVYLWIIPHCLSYQNAWVEPEQFHIKSSILKTGTHLNLKDIKQGLFWQFFEYKPRCTRPLSSYFEIIDTKFRCWLWHYIMPHPSLSLTWVFSLILAPLFLYRLLKNLDTNSNLSQAMVAFFLATPGILSHEVMLFRPAKPMANFFIIFCLYLASTLKKEFLDTGKTIPTIKFLIFWIITACSFYWDETALLIFPAVLFIFPSIFKRKSFLFFWFLLPLITLIAYLEIIPYLCMLAGHDWPHLLKYDLIQSLGQAGTIHHSTKYLGANARNLILETMGMFSFSHSAPKSIIISMALAVISWITILFYALKIKKEFDPLILFLLFLLFVFNAILSVTMAVWGPYYYGSFWSIFFVIFLSKHIGKSNVPQFVLSICFFFIIISATNCFIGTNIIYKKYHWYPYNPDTIEDYFKGTRLFFDKRDAPVFPGKDIRSTIYKYWSQVKNGKNIESLSLPRELGWLPIELEPAKFYLRFIPGGILKSDFQAYFSDGAEILDWLVQKGYLVKYPQENYFIKEDLNTTITNGLKENYPDRWGKILAVLQEAQSRKPYFYIYTDPGLAETYNNRGNAYYMQGNLTQAIYEYTKAVELKPDLEDAYYNLGLIHYKQGNLIQAISNYNKAIEINPKDIECYNDRAIIYYQLKEYDNAWGDVRTLQKLGAAANPKLISALKQVSPPPAEFSGLTGGNK